jgi:hypothetical protein
VKPLHQGKGDHAISKIPIAQQGHDPDRFGRLSKFIGASLQNTLIYRNAAQSKSPY